MPCKAPKSLGRDGVNRIVGRALRPGLEQTHELFDAILEREGRTDEWAVNFGLANGPLSGVLGIDVDPRKFPHPDLVAALEAATPVRTSSGRGTGGKHYYFAWTPDLDRFAMLFRECHVTGVAGSSTRDATICAIEIPWNLVLPPSTHPKPETGDGRYVAEGPPLRATGAGAPPPLPESCRFVVEALERALALRESGAGAESSRERGWYARAMTEPCPDGARTETLKSLVANWTRRGATLEEAQADALTWNKARCVPPEDESVVLDHVRGCWRRFRARQEAETLAATPSVVVGANDGWPVEVPTWRDLLPELPSASLFRTAASAREVTETGATALEVPRAYVGMTLLSGVSAAAMGRAKIVLRRDWHEVSPLWACVLGPAAKGKTRAFERFVEPYLRSLDDERAATFGARARRARVEIVRTKRKIDDLQRGNSSGKHDAELESLYAQHENLLLDGRAKPRMLMASGSQEGMRDRLVGTARVALLLGEAEVGRVAWFTDEKSLFVSAASSASGSGFSDDTLLKRGYSGQSVSVGLVKADIYVPRAYVTCCVLPQPKVLRGLRGSGSFKHAAFESGGLLSRFVYSWPEPPRVDRRLVLPPIAQRHVDALGERLKAVAAIDRPRVYTLAPGGLEVVHAFRLEVDDREYAGDLHDLPSWAGRAAGHAGRVALALHLLSPGWQDREVPVETVRAAVDFVREYCVPHAIACWDLFDAAGPRDTGERIWRKLGRREAFGQNMLTCGLAGGLKLRAEVAAEAMRLGTELGFWRLERERTPGSDRRTWVTNPRARARLTRGRSTTTKR